MNDPNAASSNLQDSDLVRLIDALVTEEHRLEREHAGEGPGAGGRDRLGELEVQLDQAWDLLRRRRARRDAGLDPDAETVRDPDVVENYEQ